MCGMLEVEIFGKKAGQERGVFGGRFLAILIRMFVVTLKILSEVRKPALRIL